MQTPCDFYRLVVLFATRPSVDKDLLLHYDYQLCQAMCAIRLVTTVIRFLCLVLSR